MLILADRKDFAAITKSRGHKKLLRGGKRSSGRSSEAEAKSRRHKTFGGRELYISGERTTSEVAVATLSRANRGFVLLSLSLSGYF